MALAQPQAKDTPKPLSKADCLKELGKNLSEENLQFLAELSGKHEVNKKLLRNKRLIRSFL